MKKACMTKPAWVKRILRMTLWPLIAFLLMALLRVFVLDIYKVDSSSMERELFTGDIIVVNKLKYGARMPMSLREIPLLSAFSYIPGFRFRAEKEHWEYRRLPAFSKIKRNDVIVFDHPQSGLPVVKRCVGLPGDTVAIRHNNRYANRMIQQDPSTVVYSYCVKSRAGFISEDTLSAYGLTEDDVLWRWQQYYHLSMTDVEAAGFRKCLLTDTLFKDDYGPDAAGPSLFPGSRFYRFSRENYGPLIVPKKNMTIRLDERALDIYRSAIEMYEGNKLEMRDGSLYINGVQTNVYCFKMDYFFVLGDNRYHSIDSRYWGFVPEHSIVGVEDGIVWKKKR